MQINDETTVLIVDDRPANIETLQAMLAGLDLKILTAPDGVRALQLLKIHEVAVALLDVCMPGMNGLELARQMNLQRDCPPIIFLTAADAARQSMLDGYDAGSVDFLYKPLDPVVIRAKVRIFVDLFRRRKAQESLTHDLEVLAQSLGEQRLEAELTAHELALQKEEMKRQNHELALRNHQLDSFGHVVSHDLRQPLQAILDYLELIDSSSREYLLAQAVRWLELCVKLGRDMQMLISAILEYSSLGSHNVVAESTDAGAALQAALQNLSSLITKEDAQISQDPLPPVLCTGKLLTSAFENLIGNAIKYRGKETPRIHIGCNWNQDDGKWWFQVKDNGRGIRRQDFEEIFEMFGRASEVRTIQGTGIGLAASKRIIESHGGRIWVESEPGQGSSFYFSLPGIHSRPGNHNHRKDHSENVSTSSLNCG
jgi:signal transduction histidine kinase